MTFYQVVRADAEKLVAGLLKFLGAVVITICIVGGFAGLLLLGSRYPVQVISVSGVLLFAGWMIDAWTRSGAPK